MALWKGNLEGDGRRHSGGAFSHGGDGVIREGDWGVGGEE